MIELSSIAKILLLFSIELLLGFVKSDTCFIPAICDCNINRTIESNASNVSISVPQTASFAVRFGENICTNLSYTDFSLHNASSTTAVKADIKSLSLFLNCSYVDITNSSKLPPANGTSFYLNLSYPCNNPSPPPENVKGYSTGSILVIIFFTLVFAYLGLGIAVNYYILGAQGLEIIPNLGFWREFPGLVKDGATFVQNGCKVPQDELNPRSPDSYDAI